MTLITRNIESMTNEFAAIERAVCARFFVTWEEMASDSRARDIARPRQVLMFLARERTALSFPEIGDIMGKHHTTVLHGFRTIQKMVWVGHSIARDIDAIRAVLESQKVAA